jgi:3-oxoacyl-[acyl-carrier protein] reductase
MKESAAVVTGATQGIGRATAVRLAKEFSALALGCSQRESARGSC